MLFHTLGPSSIPVVVAQLDERHANRAASMLECYDRHKALEHSTTSSSNEKEGPYKIFVRISLYRWKCIVAKIKMLLDVPEPVGTRAFIDF